MEKTADPKNRYEKAKKKRQEHVDAVLNSPSKEKIVVAGPGTGKTYLFKRVIEGKKKSLALTFVNALVEDLSLELCGLSEVRTLHSFACRILNNPSKDVKIFPKLSEVIKEDAKILLYKEIDFDKIFHNRNDENEHIIFYKKRKDYYGKYYGYSDIIFALVKYLEINRNKIPIYEQVVVDEFQDFNKLEVSLIELLSEKSPILLAGDDDQALYDFKSASAEHIRERHSDKNREYASFSLPHCSRCTRVIVETANDIINMAEKEGFLKNRINKEYCYFEDKKKDEESNRHPKVIYTQIFDKQIPWFIEKQIGDIAEEIKERFSVLIISPTRGKVHYIGNALKNKGFKNIKFVEGREAKEPVLMDGLKILLDNKKSNLGWRIVSKSLLEENDFESIIRKTDIEKPKNISEIVNNNFKKEISGMLKILRAVKNNKRVEEMDFQNFLQKIGHNPYENSINFLRNKIIPNYPPLDIPGLRKISIKSTTIESSKGLAAEYVFITHFDDQYFIKGKDKNNISDRDICNFLVALTRAKRKVFLISSNCGKEPTFLKWINEDRLDKLPSSAVPPK